MHCITNELHIEPVEKKVMYIGVDYKYYIVHIERIVKKLQVQCTKSITHKKATCT